MTKEELIEKATSIRVSCQHPNCHGSLWKRDFGEPIPIATNMEFTGIRHSWGYKYAVFICSSCGNKK